MQIYNSNALDNNKRFLVAILIGILSAIVLGFAYGLFISLIHIQFQFLYLGIGWGIGTLIQKYGRGVTTKFCVLGALCTLLAIIIGDLCATIDIQNILSVIVTPSLWGDFLKLWMQMYLSTNLNNILGIILRGMGIYCGYHYSTLF